MRAGAALPLDRVLGLCASPVGTDAQTAALAAELPDYPAWSALPQAAEAHGIAPLVDARLGQPALAPLVPGATRAQLRGLTMRHRRANQLRQTLLAELADAFARRSLPLLVLKGGALAFSVYAEPGLRAMRDLDLLVRESELAAAAEVLRTLGYQADDEAGWADSRDHQHHQPALKRQVDGYTMTLEVHRQLGIPTPHARKSLDELAEEAVPLQVGGVEARTLGPVDMLVHVHYHGFCTPLAWPDRLRLVSAADLFALVSAWHARIDWKLVAQRSPQLQHSLAWLSVLAPWPAQVREALSLEAIPDAFALGHDYHGWPRESTAERADLFRHVLDTWRPPAWWLRMRHGGRPGPLGYLGSWLRHVRELT
jgi:hypothetical protein